VIWDIVCFVGLLLVGALGGALVAFAVFWIGGRNG
jgi:hypothetical protein